jgi:hypothetical protein
VRLAEADVASIGSQRLLLAALDLRKAASRRIVLEYGCTTTGRGPHQTAYTTFVRVVGLEGYGGSNGGSNGGSDGGGLARVGFNINPDYKKPTATVLRPSSKRGAEFEYVMGRSFPCFITVTFSPELGNIPELLLKFWTVDGGVARRVVVESPKPTRGGGGGGDMRGSGCKTNTGKRGRTAVASGRGRGHGRERGSENGRTPRCGPRKVTSLVFQCSERRGAPCRNGWVRLAGAVAGDGRLHSGSVVEFVPMSV